MKQYIYLFILLIFNACVDQASSDIEFTLVNETDKTVKVLGFVSDYENPDHSLRAEPIILEPNSNFKVTRYTGLNDDLGNAFYSIEGVDSVRVIFNNEKVKIFGGINDFTPYDIFTGGEDDKAFITQQDYEDAIACNDDCG